MEDAREYIREAQTAEIQGDKAQAVELLKKAADLYQREGKAMRAAQMLRHAQRLVGDDPPNGQNEIADSGPANVFHLPEPDAGSEVEGAEDLDEATHRKLVERGPTLALPALRAWCSFCCRPSDEVGPVIAGPAGAFICRTCLDESTRLLSVPRPAQPPSAAETRAKVERRLNLVGQNAGCRSVEIAIGSDIQLGIIVGPEGTGKTEFLSHLEAKGLGTRLDPGDLATTFPEGRLFIDAAERLDASAQERILKALFEQPKRQIFLACRGRAPKTKLTLRSASVELPLYSTSALAKALDGKLEPELLERVEVISVFAKLALAELVQIARLMIAERSKRMSLSEKAILALAKTAVASGRGGHELLGLIRRIPAGGWSVEKRHARKRRD